MDTSIAQPNWVATRRTHRTSTFPFVAIPMGEGLLPVEVSLVALLGHGAGDKLFFESQARQRLHPHFVDALDEPSAKLGATDLTAGDATALYSFGVGEGGHPFHRHAGHRVFTAVSGSAGTQLRFSSATPAELERDPESFMRAMHHVNVPADCLFTVRFSGAIWHQFAPRRPRSGHPALFALSTHTDELGGELSDSARRLVVTGAADIASLTELLPPQVLRALAASPLKLGIPTTELSLENRPGGALEAACRCCRSLAGHVQRWRLRSGRRPGFVSVLGGSPVMLHEDLAEGCLLRGELQDRVVHHQDSLTLTVTPAKDRGFTAASWLAAMLQGFIDSPPPEVVRMMALRNMLVRPLGLRTSPLGCPVSSLLSPSAPARFDSRFPVYSQSVSADGRAAQVILGADDKHLVFRTCVGVRLLSDGAVEFSLANRVACTNWFGRLYMGLIAAVHRRVVAPAMLVRAVDAATSTLLSRP